MGKKKKGKGSKKGKKKGKSESNEIQFYTGTDAFTLPNGDTYVGDYMAHRSGLIWREGIGMYVTKDGQIYEGIWRDDKIIDSSNVKITYQNGAMYEGPLQKNKYQGVGTYTLNTGLGISGQFVQNKIQGDVMMVDNDGRLWHGEAHQDKAYLAPENIFFSNIEKHRGTCKRLLKLLEPEWAPTPVLPSLASTGSKLSDRALEKAIFAKNKKLPCDLDMTSTKWYQDYVKFKNERKQILAKVDRKERLTQSEKEWYHNYATVKRMLRIRAEEKAAKTLDNRVDDTLLDNYFSRAFRDSSKPYNVFYPSYNWQRNVPDEECSDLEEEGPYAEQTEPITMAEVVSEEEIDESEFTYKPTMPPPTERTKSLGVSTNSLYDFVDSVIEKNMPRVCTGNVWDN